MTASNTVLSLCKLHQESHCASPGFSSAGWEHHRTWEVTAIEDQRCGPVSGPEGAQKVKYGPRIVPGKPVSTEQFIKLMMRNTGQSKGKCKQALTNVLEAFSFYLYEGRSCHLDDWGSFAPKVGLNGRFRINYQEDPDLVEDVPQNFTGVIENAENIGKTTVELSDVSLIE